MHFLDNYRALVYFVIFLAMIIEGDIILFAAFFLAHYGRLDLATVVVVSVLGVTIGNVLWYRFGRYLEKIDFIERRAQKFTFLIDRQLERNPFRMIFLSKFTYGLHHLTIMRAGAVKDINFIQYFKRDFFATLIWIAVIGGLGYAFSASILLIKYYFRSAQIVILILFLLIISYFRIFSIIGKNKFFMHSMNKREKIQYIIIVILKSLIGVLVVLSAVQMNLFLSIMSVFVLFLTFLPAIISRSFRINLPIEIDLILASMLYLHYALGEYNGFYVKLSWWDILLHGGNSIILGMIGLAFGYSLLMTSRIKAKPIFVSSFSVFFAVFVGVLWEIFEFGMDQVFGFNMQKSGLVDTMTDLMVDVSGAMIVGIGGFFYLKRLGPSLLRKFILRIIREFKQA